MYLQAYTAIVILAIPLYKRWTWLRIMDDKNINSFCHLACVGVISYVLFVSGNYCFADPASESHGTEKIM